MVSSVVFSAAAHLALFFFAGSDFHSNFNLNESREVGSHGLHRIPNYNSTYEARTSGYRRVVDVEPYSNVGATLRPLTPIKGTNLFLNTPYKIHDQTRPGCFATWLWGKYQDHGTQKELWIVCNDADQKMYDTADSSWVFERTEGADSTSEYSGDIKIKNVGARQQGASAFLRLWVSAGNWWIGLGNYEGKSNQDMWNVRRESSTSTNFNFELKNWSAGWLRQWRINDGLHRSLVVLGNNPGFLYSMHPVIELNAQLSKFQFDRPMDEIIAEHTTKKDLIDTYDINNNSPATVSREVSVSETITDEFSWGFSESLKIFATVSGKAGIPFVAEGKVETGFDFTVTANQNWKSTEEKKFAMAYDVSLPAYTRVTISAWYERIKDISMPYTAESEITGFMTRITVYDDVVKDSPATGEMIRKYLEESKFDGKIVAINAFSVTAQIKGTMVASAGVRGQLSVDGRTVDRDPIPN